MAWKAEEMTMNTSSPRVARCRDLVADFKKGIKRDPSLFPSLKHIDNWPTFKHETMAQAFAQDIVNVFNPKYKPRGSEEKDLFTLQLYYIYAIFCSNLKTDFGQKLVRDYESSQNAQAVWKELSNGAERSTGCPTQCNRSTTVHSYRLSGELERHYAFIHSPLPRADSAI
jgi:hypothetical protein